MCRAMAAVGDHRLYYGCSSQGVVNQCAIYVLSLILLSKRPSKEKETVRAKAQKRQILLFWTEKR